MVTYGGERWLQGTPRVTKGQHSGPKGDRGVQCHTRDVRLAPERVPRLAQSGTEWPRSGLGVT